MSNHRRAALKSDEIFSLKSMIFVSICKYLHVPVPHRFQENCHGTTIQKTTKLYWDHVVKMPSQPQLESNNDGGTIESDNSF
jgi:hypothetical protein